MQIFKQSNIGRAIDFAKGPHAKKCCESLGLMKFSFVIKHCIVLIVKNGYCCQESNSFVGVLQIMNKIILWHRIVSLILIGGKKKTIPFRRQRMEIDCTVPPADNYLAKPRLADDPYVADLLQVADSRIAELEGLVNELTDKNEISDRKLISFREQVSMK